MTRTAFESVEPAESDSAGDSVTGPSRDPSRDLSEDATTVEQQELDYRSALNSAVRSLGQREHGRRELELKLNRKGHDPQLIERVMDYLLEHDLQSDARFAGSLIRSRVQRGYGPMKIRQELSAKGVSEQVLEAQLTEPSEYWETLAGESLDKKFGQAPESREAWAVQARFLARRGFPSDLIYRVLGSQTE